MTDTTLVYDDDCGFCTWWADLFDDRTDLRVVGFSDLTHELRDRLPADYEECSHLVTPEGVYSCGESIEQALVRTDIGRGAQPAVEFLRGLGPYRTLRERGYRKVAHNRAFWGKFVSKRPPARGTRDGSE